MFTIGGAWTVLVPVLLGFAWHGPRCLRGVGGCYLWVLPTSPNRMVKPRYNFLLVQEAELAIRRFFLLFRLHQSKLCLKKWLQLSSPYVPVTFNITLKITSSYGIQNYIFWLWIRESIFWKLSCVSCFGSLNSFFIVTEPQKTLT